MSPTVFRKTHLTVLKVIILAENSLDSSSPMWLKIRRNLQASELLRFLTNVVIRMF